MSTGETGVPNPQRALGFHGSIGSHRLESESGKKDTRKYGTTGADARSGMGTNGKRRSSSDSA
eukprot:1996344-Amphidinium_carterae.1